MSRWILQDPKADESWTMPINPDRMTSPHPKKSLRHAYGVWLGGKPYGPESRDAIRTFLTPPSLTEWQWEGVIRSEEHYQAYVHWTEKSHEVRVTDHLGRTWEVLFSRFEPEDRRPMKNVPWRLRYKVTAQITRRIS